MDSPDTVAVLPLDDGVCGRVSIRLAQPIVTVTVALVAVDDGVVAMLLDGGAMPAVIPPHLMAGVFPCTFQAVVRPRLRSEEPV